MLFLMGLTRWVGPRVINKKAKKCTQRVRVMIIVMRVAFCQRAPLGVGDDVESQRRGET